MPGKLKKFFAGRPPSRARHLALGARGERAALEYLKEFEGFNVVATNFRVALGRGLRGKRLTAEIDIIAYDGGTLVFVEVKTRTSDEVAAPERAVDLRKQRRIARAAHRYRHLMRVSGESYRYDVVTVIPGERADRIELLRNYFDDGVFRKGRYFKDRF
ncbi:MAG TPA: YraN family protein [Blastocatellia bacterium]|nr:YraN family protein [Blastocatellia bacterium]